MFARYAADHLFNEIDELGTRDGANLTVDGYDFAPSFSIWTTIEECLNPPVIWEKDRGWFTTPPFSEPETFDFPEGIGPVECVNVEHEEVLLMPRWVDAKRVTFKYGLGDEFIDVLKMLHKLGLDRPTRCKVGGVEVSPRDVVAACLPDPATLGDIDDRQDVCGAVGQRHGKDGAQREVYLYHVVDNARTMKEYGSQAVVWQTAIEPGGRARTACDWHVVRDRGARTRSVRRGAVPRPARRTTALRTASASSSPRPLQLARVAEGLVEHAECFVEQSVGDDQRGQEAQHVAVGAGCQHEDALLVAGLRDGAGSVRRSASSFPAVRARRRSSHRDRARHRLRRSVRLHLVQARQHQVADLSGACDEVLVLDRLDRAQRRRARDRVAAVRAT